MQICCQVNITTSNNGARRYEQTKSGIVKIVLNTVLIIKITLFALRTKLFGTKIHLTIKTSQGMGTSEQNQWYRLKVLWKRQIVFAALLRCKSPSTSFLMGFITNKKQEYQRKPCFMGSRCAVHVRPAVLNSSSARKLQFYIPKTGIMFENFQGQILAPTQWYHLKTLQQRYNPCYKHACALKSRFCQKQITCANSCSPSAENWGGLKKAKNKQWTTASVFVFHTRPAKPNKERETVRLMEIYFFWLLKGGSIFRKRDRGSPVLTAASTYGIGGGVH